MNLRPLGAILMAAALIAPLSGCGQPHPAGSTTTPSGTVSTVAPPAAVSSAADLVKAMRATAEKATSFQAAGTIEFPRDDLESMDSVSGGAGPSGSDDPNAPVSSASSTPSPATHPAAQVTRVTVAGALDGSSFELTMSAGASDAAAAYRCVGHTQYFRGNRAYFEQSLPISYDPSSTQTSVGNSVLLKYADRWVSTPATDGTAGPPRHALKQLLDETISAKQLSDADLAKAAATPIVDQGTPAYRVKVGASEWIIAADKAATLRSVVVAAGFETQRLRFSRWNDVPAFEAPADAIAGSTIPGWADEMGGAPFSSGSGSGSDSADATAYASFASVPESPEPGDGAMGDNNTMDNDTMDNGTMNNGTVNQGATDDSTEFSGTSQ